MDSAGTLQLLRTVKRQIQYLSSSENRYKSKDPATPYDSLLGRLPGLGLTAEKPGVLTMESVTALAGLGAALTTTCWSLNATHPCSAFCRSCKHT